MPLDSTTGIDMFRSFSDCLKLGLYMATAISVLAAVSVTIGAAVALLRFGWPNELPPTSEIAGGIVTVVVSYYLAGLVGGTAWFALQRISHVYVGQVLVAFVLGAIIYGAVGLSGTVAYVRFGINLLDFKSPTGAWHALPIMTLSLATFTAIIGPVIWRFQSR